MKNMDTKFMSRFADMVRLVEHQQKAIEELISKLLIVTTNVNMLTFRLSVTERLVKDRLQITPEEIERAGLAAIEQDREQRVAESATEEHPHTGSAAMPESLRSELAAGAAVPVPHRL